MPYDSNVSLIGHIGETPELKHAGETPYTKFSLAVETKHKMNGEWKKLTTWWRCTLFGNGGKTTTARIITHEDGRKQVEQDFADEGSAKKMATLVQTNLKLRVTMMSR